jgi:hypothetical protein
MRERMLWVGMGVLSLLLAAALGLATSKLTEAPVGLSAEPVSAGEALAPRPAATRAPERTATPEPGATSTPEPPEHSDESDSSGSGSGESDESESDDGSGKGRGRGRGRGRSDDDD